MSVGVLIKALNATDAALKQSHPLLCPLIARATAQPDLEAKRTSFALSLRLASLLQSGFPIELLATIAISCARSNRQFFRELCETLPAPVIGGLVGRLEKDLRGEFSSLEAISRVAALCASIVCAPSIALSIGHSNAILLRLCEVYDSVIPMNVPRSTTFELPLSDAARLALQSRLDLLEAVYEALAETYFRPEHTEERQEALAKLLLEMHEVASAFQIKARPRSLVTLGLLGDLEALCGLSDRLLPFSAREDSDLGYLAGLLKSLVPTDLSSGLELLTVTSLGSLTSPSIDKGKGRAQDPPVTDSSAQDIAAVLSILPDQPEDYVRRCLQHPRFASTARPAEALIDAFLSGSLPTELALPSEPPIPQGRSALADIRANIFEDRLDMSKTTRGKQRFDLDFDTELGRQIDEDLKRNILAFAKDDAERDAEYQREREIELDEYDPDAPVIRSHRDPMAEGDVDEGAEERDDVPDETDVSPPAASAPRPGAGIPNETSRILERAYLADPGVFAATERMRTTAARKALRDSTGMANDLIESWASMLERDPNKDRILARHATVHQGNERGLTFTDAPGQPQSQRGHGRGRGGRGSHRGGRGQHDRRQRGHDKKLARAG